VAKKCGGMQIPYRLTNANGVNQGLDRVTKKSGVMWIWYRPRYDSFVEIAPAGVLKILKICKCGTGQETAELYIQDQLG